MISKLPLFSGLTTVLWAFCLWSAVLTGFLHLPVVELLPFSLPANLPIGRLHFYAGAATLFFASYGTVIWLFQGRKKYRLTFLGHVEAFFFATVLGSGILLFSYITAFLPLYGMAISIIRAIHLFSACCIFIGLIIFVLMFVFYKPFPSYRKLGAEQPEYFL